MPNTVLSRIDERLIHGQVGMQWVGFAGANLVRVANDPVQQNLLEMVRFWSLQKADRQNSLSTPATLQRSMY